MTVSPNATAQPTNIQLAGVSLAGVATGNGQLPVVQANGVFVCAAALPTPPAASPSPMAEAVVDSVAGECKVAPVGTVKVCSEHVITEHRCTVTVVDSLGKTYKGVFDEAALADSATFRSSMKIKPGPFHEMFKCLVQHTRGPLKIDEFSVISPTPGSELAFLGERCLRCKFTVTQNSSLGLEGCCYLVEQPQDAVSRLEGVILSLISRIVTVESKRA